MELSSSDSSREIAVALIGFDPATASSLRAALDRAAKSRRMTIRLEPGGAYSVTHDVRGAIIMGRPNAGDAWLLQAPCLSVVPAEADAATLQSLLSTGVRDFVTDDTDHGAIAERFLHILQQDPTAASPELDVAIVEDDDYSRDALMMSIGSSNIARELRGFSSAAELLEEAEGFNLFIVDIVIGAESGVWVIEQLRERLPSALIIGVSRSASVGLQQSVLLAGADAFLVKPVHPRQMKMTVHHLAEKHRQGQTSPA